jgi:penicillin amidase
MRGFDTHPSEYNPAKGWFASANQNNLPSDYPRERIPAFSFRDPYRYDRIVEVLAKGEKHSIADSIRLQYDVFSTPAQQLLKLLPRQPSDAARPAVTMLAGWNAHLDADSAPAALFQLLWRELGQRMLAAIVPPKAKELVTEIAASELLRLLQTPDRQLGTDPAAARDALFEAALIAAWNKAQQELGTDPRQWRWDRLHQVRIEHPLSRVPAIAAAFPAIEGAGSGGDGFTVMARWIPPKSGWRTTGGASYLQVIDVGAWDNSVFLNLPGQSNDPRSPHRQDHYAPWIAGQMMPMLFSRGAVDARAEQRTILSPESR